MTTETYQAADKIVYKNGQPWHTTRNHHDADDYARRANAREAKEVATKRRSAKVIAKLTHDEYQALVAYKGAYGLTWKNRLNLHWAGGKFPPNDPDDEPHLRSVRNKIGPSGLAKLRITRKS